MYNVLVIREKVLSLHSKKLEKNNFENEIV